MTKPAFVFASDTHLEEFSYIDMPEMYGDTFVAFEQVIDYAIDKELNVVLGGDNFECNRQHYPTAVTIRFASQQLQRLEKANLKLYYVNGQHDRATRNVSWFSAINDRVARSLHMTPSIIGGLEVIGINSVFSHELQSALDVAEKCLTRSGSPILVVHQRWKEFLKFEGAEDGSFKMIPKIFKTVITGDLHKATWFKSIRRAENNKKVRDRFVVSPGSTVRRSSAEGDEHFVHVMHDNHKVTSSRLKERPVLRLTVKDVHDVDAIADEFSECKRQLMEAMTLLPAQIAKPLVIVSGVPTLPLFNAVKEMFGDLAFVRLSGRSGRESTAIAGMETRSNATLAGLSCRDYINELAMDPKAAELARVAMEASVKSNKDLIDNWRTNYR
jgi:hypothetical protein